MIPSLNDLWESTENLYDRFETHPTSQGSAKLIMEECAEMLAELSQFDKANLAEEFADVIVVGIGALMSKGLTMKDLERAMLKVIIKNDSKNHDTHIIYNGKITRKEKVANHHDSD